MGSSKTEKINEIVSKDNATIRLFNKADNESTIEFGPANPKSAILLAKYEGKVYVEICTRTLGLLTRKESVLSSTLWEVP